jgi:hypothetical protein
MEEEEMKMVDMNEGEIIKEKTVIKELRAMPVLFEFKAKKMKGKWKTYCNFKIKSTDRNTEKAYVFYQHIPMIIDLLEKSYLEPFGEFKRKSSKPDYVG